MSSTQALLRGPQAYNVIHPAQLPVPGVCWLIRVPDRRHALLRSRHPVLSRRGRRDRQRMVSRTERSLMAPQREGPCSKGNQPMNVDSPSRAVSDEAVLRIVREVLTELHPGRKDTDPVTLDSALEEDLGLDSLARVELLMRLEHAFGVRPPEQLLSTAEAPRDLLRALLAARGPPQAPVLPARRLAVPERVSQAPHAAAT